ncbi:ribonuclease III [Magnetospira sp. QH-2]|uniref:ribonuclease III n=1 Tax=Magnetospira sp. (strain QH-2) TaxID=1288970 RepID=UPI0003E813C7|nr:ribonuclease III [Magnetospira sp. QH-2]CCQ73575.1 Ribonuclease III [Magnetospira sp. QH-2]
MSAEWPRGDLEKAIGHRFSDSALLERALTHSSLISGIGSNERLEFLGDRVLGLGVAELLYQRFPDEEEGPLARRFAAVVSQPALADVARLLNLGRHLNLARSEEDGGGRDNPALLSDACEALIAALYLDGGMEVALTFVRRLWAPLIDADLSPPKDAKTALQEWAQGRGKSLPQYREVGRDGPSHAPVFTMEACVEGLGQARANGTSKRAAEQAAAVLLLNQTEDL